MARVPGPMLDQCDHCTETDYTELWTISRGGGAATVEAIVCRQHSTLPIQTLYNGGTKGQARTVVGPKRGLSWARLESLAVGDEDETAP